MFRKIFIMILLFAVTGCSSNKINLTADDQHKLDFVTNRQVVMQYDDKVKVDFIALTPLKKPRGNIVAVMYGENARQGFTMELDQDALDMQLRRLMANGSGMVTSVQDGVLIFYPNVQESGLILGPLSEFYATSHRQRQPQYGAILGTLSKLFE